ncbi:hypothetical protein DFQ28_000653 [Apophysomyces sp. BC1034]|nr:hypothetical protein DFQ29_003766 [Apophysomyces sp. BC1021]KAG0191258.1 hypothetical protein DFQ28_000653 [Apophysomyces sp. BC1034]
MLQTALNYVGLGPIEPYIQPRLSIGAGVSEQTYGVGQFKVQIDAEELTLVIKNNRGRTIWKCRLLDGESMLSLISEYTTFSGRMKPLPQWILQGAVANIQGGEEKVRQVVKQLRQYKVPMAAIWIQDWCGKHVQEKDYGGIFKQIWYNWESDDELYPHWDALVEELQEDGIRVLAYTNVLLTDTRSKPNVRRNLFKEAQQNGYLVKDALGQALITCSDTSSESGILDLTNPEAVVWFKKVLTDLVWKTGVAGMMADCGQNFPYDTRNCTLYSGELAETYHNQYSANWAKLHCDLIHELGMENEAVNFYRSGYITTPDYASLIWVGEQTTTWNHVDGIKSAITGMLSGGFSGFSVTHSDIGGYTTIDSVIPGIQMHRSKELLQRWMELAVFTAVFRTHEGSVPENNAQFYDNEESFTHFAHTANMYVSLAPYREHLINEAHEKGWPLMRHMVLYYPDDPTVRQITYSQFMLGPWLLVAPVTSPSASFVKVYFPKENNQTLWRHIWTGKYYAADGSYVAVNTPLGQPAAFVKEPREDGGLLHGLLEYARNAYCNPPPS